MLMFEVMFPVVTLERKLETTETQTSTTGTVLVNQASLQRKNYAFNTFVVSITIADPPSIHPSVHRLHPTDQKSKKPKGDVQFVQQVLCISQDPHLIGCARNTVCSF